MAAALIDKLKEVVRETSRQQKVDEELERLATDRIDAARRELAVALAVLIPIAAKSEEAREAAKAALQELDLFKRDHRLPE